MLRLLRHNKVDLRFPNHRLINKHTTCNEQLQCNFFLITLLRASRMSIQMDAANIDTISSTYSYQKRSLNVVSIV